MAMIKKFSLLSIEAMILGGPTTILLIVFSPYILIGSIYTLIQGDPTALIGAVSCLWSLLHFWKLVFCTISGTHYKFGIGFLFAVVGAIVGALIMHVGIPNKISVILIGLPCIGMLHFVYEQLKFQRIPSTT